MTEIASGAWCFLTRRATSKTYDTSSKDSVLDIGHMERPEFDAMCLVEISSDRSRTWVELIAVCYLSYMSGLSCETTLFFTCPWNVLCNILYVV